MSIQSLLQKSLGSTATKAERDFAAAFFARISPDDLALLDAAQIKAITKTHLRLSAGRKHGDTKISFTSNAVAGMAWDDRRTYLDIVNDDLPFLIDSVAALLGERRCLIDMLLHPRMNVVYDAKKTMQFDDAGHGRQSHIHIVIKGFLSADQQKELSEDLLSIIRDVHFSTRDWQAMRVRAIEAKQHLLGAPEDQYDRDELTEFSEFLDYIYDNNFTFLGCREYRFTRDGNKIISHAVKGSGLGVLADDKMPAYISETKQPLPSRLQEIRTRMPALNISKVNRTSTVHRRVPLDAVTVHHFNDKGDVIGETLFVGLFTSVTYSRSLRSIPLLKYKMDMMLRTSGFEPASHDGRALRHILEKYPRDELFQIDVDDLYPICLSILRLQERQRIALYCRRDPFNRYVSCLVYVPRDRFDTRLRLKFQTILENELGGTCSNYNSSVDDSPLVRILYNISISQQKPKEFDAAAVEEKLQNAGRLWGDMLGDAVHARVDDDRAADRLILQYRDAFSADYAERYNLDDAVSDIEKIEACLASQSLEIDLQHRNDELTLKIYTPEQALVLSDILPILENMGLRVMTEHPFAIVPQGAKARVVMQDFSVTGDRAFTAADVARLKPLFEDAFVSIHRTLTENDTLNMLVLRAGLSARDVMILRTFVRYLRQTGLPFSLPYMEQAVTTYPKLAGLFVDLFKAMFDPKDGAKRGLDKIHTAIVAELEAVKSLDHDRILRALYEVLRNALRTNYYQTDTAGAPKPYLSVKLDSRAISFLPNPKPYREVFVYSSRMEGVHLRNGRIARGGIRWSDRAEDFRTEVLGLMKAQTVKNSVIVPSGAKGGFIVKRPPVGGDRAAIQAEGIECYRMLVRGLLDITDNYGKGNKVIKPKAVKCLDADDPYLVVAADKGTATFSDIANALSAEYGFWMGDGFASGGSAGYDHKAMGITARGAWESVKRHFREMGHDTQKQEFDVIGVGDMGGDVFGNGMLLSPHIRLVGAFNHVHIFCDPNPDVAATFAERKRLFKGVMGWDSYNTKLLSKGGRIYSRKDKVLELTPEIQKRFDLPKAKVTPPELMQAMLRARTDLIYLGGIGTYVKASTETHADAGDRSNDAQRINANELRAHVVGEGANLGFTQRARIEYAQNGGRLNADFIDNSAGVDTSDHEVNIKILTSTVMAKSPARLNRTSRDKLLKGMTDEVAQLVLNDNYQQTQAISVLEMQAAELLPQQQRFIQDLERDGVLDRALEFLPDDEAIAARHKAGKGLTRPEIGIIVSYSKIRVCDELLATDIPDRSDLDNWVIGYFPQALQTKFKDDILAHPLRREIIATLVANQLVNRLGPTFVRGCMNDYNVDVRAVAQAFIASCVLLDMPAKWAAIEAMDAKVHARVQLAAFAELAKLLTRMIGWLLATEGNKIQIDRVVKAWSGPVADLTKILMNDKSIKTVLVPEQMASHNDRRKEWVADGVPATLADMLAVRTKLALAPHVLSLAQEMKKPIATIAETYYPLGHHFAFSWLRTQMDLIAKPDRWSVEAANSLEAQIDKCQVGLARMIMRSAGTKAKGNVLSSWLAANTDATADIFALIADIRRTGLNDLTVLMVLLQRIERLI